MTVPIRSGKRRQIVNQRFFEQYQRLLDILSYKAELDHDDLMSVTYYLLLQDRVAEALEFFGRVDAERLESKLQYDYFAAYLALYQGKLPEARELTDRWLQHPVDRWRNAFAAIDQQLKEIAGAATGGSRSGRPESEPDATGGNGTLLRVPVGRQEGSAELSESDRGPRRLLLDGHRAAVQPQSVCAAVLQPVRQHSPQPHGRTQAAAGPEIA